MNLKQKIGVWGFGVVGRSVINFLITQGVQQLFIYNDKELSASDQQFFKKNNVVVLASLNQFLEGCDLIVSSPGVCLDDYQKYKNKFFAEADLFYEFWQKPIIAVTGTLGKTSTVSVLAQALQDQGVRAIAAGNIGLGMCDLLGKKIVYDVVVLELSSFQLNSCKKFAPDIAVITNFYANHIDWHKNEKNYLVAKTNIFKFQNKNQKVLLPLGLQKQLQDVGVGQKYYFDLQKSEKNFESPDFFVENKKVILQKDGSKEVVCDFDDVGNIYPENILMVCAVLNLYGIKGIKEGRRVLSLEHRLEKFYSKDGIDYYNDSKSTVPQATLAAVQKLNVEYGNNIILFLGGLGKGVDRSSLVAQIANRVGHVICFGAEAEELFFMCQVQKIESSKFDNLEGAVMLCKEVVQQGDAVLFSPAGSSFDLFKNYNQRGEIFKKLII